MIEVDTPDGVAEFPDGTPKETIQAALQKRYGAAGGPVPAGGGLPPAAPGLTQPGASTAVANGGAAAPAQPPAQDGPELGVLDRLGRGSMYGAQRASRGVADFAAMMGSDYVGGPLKKWAMSKGLVPSDEQLEESKARAKEAGWLGTVGQVGTETLATLAPAGKAAEVTGKVLTTAVPALSKVAKFGGNRVFNLGTAGKSAVEGGAAAGLVSDGGDDSKAGDVALGTALGGVVPAVFGALSAPIKAAWSALAPTAKAATMRAAKAFERTLGISETEAIEQAVRQNIAEPSVLPKTTAALADNTHLGAMERGARGRGLADFEKHDQTVAKKAWTEFGQGTSQADVLPALESVPDDIMNAGKKAFSRMALPNGVRDTAVTQLTRLADSGEALARPEVRRELDHAIRALSHASAGGEVLPQLVWGMGKEAGKSDTISLAKKMLAQHADDISDGQFTTLQQSFGQASDVLKGSQGAEKLRESFMSAGGAPLTPRAYGTQATGGATPVLTSHDLSTQLASKGEEVMDPAQVQKLSKLADELRRHEIYSPTPGLGVTQPQMGPAQGVGTAAVNASPAWQARGVVGTLFGTTNRSTKKAIDAALLNPEEFLRTMEMKRAMNRPLDKTEQALEQLLRAQGRAIGTATSGE